MEYNTSFNRKHFLEIVNSHSSDELSNIYKIIFGEHPRERSTVKLALRKFNGLEHNQLESTSKTLDENYGTQFLLETANLLSIKNVASISIEEVCKRISTCLCKTPPTNSVTEGVEEEEDLVSDEDIVEYQNKNYEDNSNGESSKTELYNNIEKLDDENMDFLLKINDIEEEIDALEKSEKTEENITRTRSLNRTLRILNAKSQSNRTKRQRLEEELTKTRPSTSSLRKYNCHHRERVINPNVNSNHSQVNLESTISTMMLRQTVGTKLPDFDGTSPLAWSHFQIKFNVSTSECKMSDEENLLRLNQHLKGEAREKVKLLLLSSNSPQQILSILDRQYGGDDKILQEIINEIQKVKFVNSLLLFEDFNCSVQNTAAVLSKIRQDFFDLQKILAIYLNKLPEHIVMQWASYMMANSIDSKNMKFPLFANWVQTMSQIVSDVNFTTHIPNIKYDKKDEKSDEKSVDKTCKICKTDEHFADKCEEFLKSDITKRWDLVRKFRYCFNCLKLHKGLCRKKDSCKIQNCNRRHHELLHKYQEHHLVNVTHEEQNEEDNFVAVTHNIEPKVLLKMLPLKITGPLGSVNIMAMLDEGSTLTLLDRSIAESIGLSGEEKSLCFKWTGGIFRNDPKSKEVSAEITGQNGLSFKLENIRTVENLDLPFQNTNVKNLTKQYPDLNKFAVSSINERKPMILISQRHASLITAREVIEIDPTNNGPLLTRTKLGWALHGPVNWNINSTNFVCCQVEEDVIEGKLDAKINDFFSMENFGACIPKEELLKKQLDEEAISIANSSIKLIDGQYEIKLPWKNENIKMPDSKPMAIQRFKCLERQFHKDIDLKEAYEKQINALLSKGYARKVQPLDLQNKKRLWFLPHFAVKNPKKPDKPPRVVFDAAAKTNNLSLNDFLHCGPDWLCSIIGVLMRFRKYMIAFAGDIQEMFNRVNINDEDVSAQCFLWRKTANDPVEIFQMKAMLFGLNCSPFLAQYVKNYNAKQYKSDYPDAFTAIVRNHYVDDYLDSVDTEAEAVSRIKSVIHVHKQGGFKIRGFTCNSLDVLSQLPKDYVSSNFLTSLNGNENKQKILGLLWNTSEDCFIFQFSIQNASFTKYPTKRQVLKTIMSVFDPLGFITPITIKARILMQNIWKSNVGWDNPINSEDMKLWVQWLQDLSALKNMKIKRCYKRKIEKPERIELHIFSDASIQAYCSVAYIRYIYTMNEFETNLVFSKARVAPKSSRNITIPRMELLAALLGTRIANTIQKEIEIEFNKIFFWTDSTTVLQWIQTNKPLKPFIADRIAEILENTKNAKWMWLPTKQNPADQGTRVVPVLINKNPSWLKGPIFLMEPEESWKSTLYADISRSEEETSAEEICCVIITEEMHNHLPDIRRFSNINKLEKTTVRVKQFVTILKTKLPANDFITTEELIWARNEWIKLVQATYFAGDLNKILGKKTPNEKIRLSKYPIKLDANNILRINGRIERASISRDSKNPIVLDSSHTFTKLIIKKLHEEANHYGVQTVVNLFRRTYWMPKMTHKIKQILNECHFCKRFKNSKTEQPCMGNLPRERFLTLQKTFTAAGVDFFGPFYIKHGRKVETRYGMLFTCLTSRAIHIEITHSLTTDSCIMAIRRMMARRGQVTYMMSDNGTNLKGANKELLEALDELHPDTITNELLKYGINWRFNPPSAPHFGGCWERLIGCFKKSIESVLSVNRHPTDEMLLTIFTEAEHLINSRPYLKQSDDPFDNVEITPNDILIPYNINILPATNSNSDCISKRNWRISQHLIELFWEKFIKDYIPTLLLRMKWFQDVENLKIGDIVLMKETCLRRDWPIGIITQVFPGSDTKVRVVEIKTSKNLYTRPTNKIVKLDLEIH